MDRLKSIFPPWTISSNPWDLGVTMQFTNPKNVYPTLLESVIQDPRVDALAIQLPSMAYSIPKEFFSVFQGAVDVRKPIALWLAGVEAGRYESLEWAEEMNVPVFSAPEKAIRALSALHRLSFA